MHKKQKIKPKTYLTVYICYSSLVCLYKFRKKGLFLGGKMSFRGGGGQGGTGGGGPLPPPQLVC
jgi:hypothetical protein